ncbi:transporter, partial [Myxococcota bacterium]|nr:transporter [Myxococcota bacterium]
MHSPRFSPKFILSFVLAFLLSSTAFAQTGAFKDFALDRYTPGIDRESVAGVELGEVPLHLSWDALLWAGYSHNVLMLARDDGDTTDRVGSIIGQRFTTHLGASISLFDWIQIGVDLPFIASQARGDEPSPPDASLGELTQSGLGDLRISPKIPLLSADKAFVDVALLPVFTIPTATQDAYLGEDGISATPSIAISKRFGGLRLALNAGYFWRPSNTFLDLDIGPETRFSLGAAQDLNTL